MGLKDTLSKFWIGASIFALTNVAMLFLYTKVLETKYIPFWIGGSSFLPLIGVFGKGEVPDLFIGAMIVNIGVIVGSFLSAMAYKEFILRMPNGGQVVKAIVGGILMGIGFTLAPGTCTTPFVTGMQNLGVNSYLSVAGIIIGTYFGYKTLKRLEVSG